MRASVVIDELLTYALVGCYLGMALMIVCCLAFYGLLGYVAWRAYF